MKFKVMKCVDLNNWFIILEPIDTNKNSIASDISIAKFLDISLKEYREILVEYKAYQYKEYNNECYFQTMHDATNCIDELDKYLVMAKLTEE